MAKEGKYLNPLTDFGFKYFFGNDANDKYLISFLNALFDGEPEIISIQRDDKEHVGRTIDSRAMIYDLHCRTADGRTIIVEMQNRYQTYFRDRALYYVSADIYSQGLKGDEWHYRLTPVYGIFLMNFDWKEFENDPIREDVCLTCMQSGMIFSDRIKMVFLKVPLMEKRPEECNTDFDRWMYLFKNLDKMEQMPKEFMTKEIFRSLEKMARVGALSEEQRREYEHSLKVYRDNYAVAKTERDLGRAEGIAEGRAEGIAEGEAKGKAMMVRSMLANGLDIAYISQISGLSVQEITALTNSTDNT